MTPREKPMAKLNELFDVTYGNKFDLNKLGQRARSEGGVSFVGRSEKNLGVTATVAPIASIDPFPSGLITVALGGTKLLCSYVQQFPFYTAQNVAVLRPKVSMTFDQLVYVCACIKANRFRYGAFGREANRTLRTLEIPDAVNEAPNWLAGVNSGAFAPVAGILDAVAKMSVSSPSKQTVLGTDGMARVADLFDVFYGSNLELNSLKGDPNGINFVSRTARNNGVSALVAPVANLPPTPGGVLSVAGGGSVLETFYQVEPFYSGRDLYFLKPKVVMTPEEMLFYATCIRANQYRYSYGRQANRTLKELLVPAPNQIPAWVYGACERVAQSLAS